MAINHRILYIGSSRFPVTGRTLAQVIADGPVITNTDYTRLIDWCKQNLITGIKWYCAGQNMSNMRRFINAIKKSGDIYSHQFVFSGGYVRNPYPDTQDLLIQPYGYRDVATSDAAASAAGINEGRFFQNNYNFIYPGRTFDNFKNTGYDLEYEFYNSGSGGSQAIPAFNEKWAPRMANGARGLLYTDTPGFDRSLNANTSYLGWWGGVPQAPELIVATHTRIDLHAYTRSTLGTNALFSYTRSRLEDLATAQKIYWLSGAQPRTYRFPAAGGGQPNTVDVPRNPAVYRNVGPFGNKEFEFYPIFSMETANLDANGTYNHLSPYQSPTDSNNFSGMLCSSATLPGVTPIVGQNLTFDELFNYYLSGNSTGIGTTGTSNFRYWKSTSTAVDTGYIKEPDGYVLFSYVYAYAARPL